MITSSAAAITVPGAVTTLRAVTSARRVLPLRAVRLFLRLAFGFIVPALVVVVVVLSFSAGHRPPFLWEWWWCLHWLDHVLSPLQPLGGGRVFVFEPGTLPAIPRTIKVPTLAPGAVSLKPSIRPRHRFRQVPDFERRPAR